MGRQIAVGFLAVLVCSMFAAAARAEAGTLADSNGQIVAWGNNDYNQCSDTPTGNVHNAIAAGARHGVALKSDGSLDAWGWNSSGQCTWPAGNNYAAVAAGFSHSLALKADGSLAAWGSNGSGQCDVPAGNNYAAIAAGDFHSLALKADGSLAAWGRNYSGQCDVPAGNDFAAVAAGNYHNLALRADGSLAAWGSNSYGECNVPAGNNYAAVAAGGYHSLALKADGSLAAWGWNDDGQCDVPAGVFVAVAAGDGYSLALKARTDYSGDLLVSGTGVSANLNRSITVAGKATVYACTMFLHNYPTMNVNGTLSVANSSIVGDGVIAVQGRLAASGSTSFNGNIDVTAAGLSGSGSLYLNDWARLILTDAESYGGKIYIDNSSLVLIGNGGVTAKYMSVNKGSITGGGAITVDGDLALSNQVAFDGNMSVAVTGKATVEESKIRLYNNPWMYVGGNIAVNNSSIVGEGEIASAGELAASGAVSLASGVHVRAGGLSGSGRLDLKEGARLMLTAGKTYTGKIYMDNSTLVLYDTGAVTADYLSVNNASVVGNGPIAVNGDLAVSSYTSFDGNMSLAVAGNAAVKNAYMQIYGNPSMNVAGGLAVQNATLWGEGVIAAQGELALSGQNWFFGNMNMTAGGLSGSGELFLNGTSLTVAAGKAYSGNLHMYNANLALSGTGAVTAQYLGVYASSSARVNAGQRLETTSNLENASLIQVLGNALSPAELNVRSYANNYGLISARDASLTFGILDNFGALALTGGTNDINGKIYNWGGGTITVTGGATAVFYDDIVQNGTMTVRKVGSTTSVAVLLGALTGSGGITGGGDVFLEGDLRPGNSPAAVTYDCNLFLGSGAYTVMELAGTVLGAEYDHITVTGELVAGGTLEVVLLNNFAPAAGQSFDLFDAAFTGTFDSVILPGLGTGLAWDASGLYSQGTLSVAPEPATLALFALGGGLMLVRRRARKT